MEELVYYGFGLALGIVGYIIFYVVYCIKFRRYNLISVL